MKKHNYLNKSQKLLLTAIVIPVIVSSITPITFQSEEVYANTISTTPVMRVYELNGSPKLEWATEILDENVLWLTSFEEGQIIPLYNSWNDSSGKQNFKNENGNNFAILNDNITNREGNLYSFPAVDSTISILSFPRLYINNKTNLSVSFKARNVNATENFISVNAGDNHGDKGVYTTNNGKYIVFDEYIDFKNPPETIKIKYEDGTVINDLSNNALFRFTTSKQSNQDYGIIFYFWDSESQILRKSTSSYSVVGPNGSGKIPITESFNKDERILVLENIHNAFPERKLEMSNKWETYNLNTFLDSDNFNYLTGGFNFAVHWSANGEIQLDDIKFGYATEVEVYRDGQPIYRGYLADFHDTTIRDNVKPNKVSSVNGSISNDFNVNFNITKPTDNGAKVNYQIQSIAQNGNRSALSASQEIEVKTDVVKYKYIVNNQLSGTPITEVSTLNNISLPLKSINLETDYLHVQAIDSNGNISDIESFKVKDILDTSNLQDLYDKLKDLEGNNDYLDFIDFIDELEGLFGDNLPQDLKDRLAELGKYHGVNTSFLLLEEGDFRLTTSDINDFGKVKLTAKKQTVTTGFTNEFGMIDARGTQEGWNVTVSATPFTVETFDGFVGTPHQLPVGSLALNAPTTVEQVGTVHNSQLPDISLNQLAAIDGGNQVVQLLNAAQQKGMGEFKFSFGADALALTVDAVTAKIDKVNYPTSNTPYVSTVTWNLISGPQ